MNRLFQILFLILVLFGAGCTGAGGPAGLGGVGGGAVGGGDGGLTPPGLPPPGGTPPPGGGAGSPNQPNQEGIPRLRPNMVLVDVKPPVKAVAARVNNDVVDGGTPENAPPQDPFPGDKPKVFVKTVRPDANYPFISTDAQGNTMVSYYPTLEKNGDTETCVTHVEIYATYQENNVDYRSDTYTSDACPGNFDQGPTPTVTLQLVASTHVNLQGISNPVYYAP